MHNLEAFQKLLTDRSFYCDRGDIKGRKVEAFPQMFKNVHRMIPHIYYSHKDLFNKCKNERYLLFCKKYKILNEKNVVIK
jgi:hypothetical protein